MPSLLVRPSLSTSSRRTFFARFLGEATFVDQDPSRADAAHLLRRLSMTVHAERVDQLSEKSKT